MANTTMHNILKNSQLKMQKQPKRKKRSDGIEQEKEVNENDTKHHPKTIITG